MRSIRTTLCLLSALVLAAFAVPGVAGPTKQYSLKADASAITYSTDPNTNQRSVNVPAPITVTVKNESPPSVANSNISSFSFTVTGMVITSVDGSACQAQGGFCTLNGNTVSVTNISQPIQAQGTFSVPVTVNSCGDGAWSAQVWNGSQLNGSQFGGPTSDPSLPTTLATNVSCGDAACGMPFVAHSTLAVAGSPTYVSGIRDAYNKDGSSCSVLDYYVTNTIPTNNKLHFEWSTTEPSAAFRYTLNFPTAVTPQLAWISDSSGPVFVDAQQCLATGMPNNLPAPYGTLAQGVNASKNKIQVNVTTTPSMSLPFPIVIGTERMQVTSIGTNFWTVARGQGGTSAAPHDAGSYVMSTPRPLIQSLTTAQIAAGYVVGYEAHGCIAFPDQSLWPSTTYDVIDIGDIWSAGK